MNAVADLPLFRPRGPAPVALRPYQREAIAAIRAALKAKREDGKGENRSTLYVAATGTGKTTIFAELTRVWPGRVLVIAHRDELLQQAQRRLEAMTDEPVELEQAEWRSGNARIVVASIQTLAREQRLHRFSPNDFGLLIVDEAHHAVATSYQRVLEWFSGAKVLGVTATPDRGDRLALGKIFDSVAMVYDIADAIKDQWLCPLVAERVPIDVDLSKIETVAGDLNQGQLDEAMGDEHVLEGVARPCFERAGDRRTVLFTTSVVNAHKLAGIFNELRPNCARAVDGGTDIDERRAILRGYSNGDFQFLCNVMIATEGWDDPATSCVAIGRPTKSRALFTQMVGRGLRIHPGKADCLVLDFAGNAGKHALVSPLDVLAGKYTDEEITLAKELGDRKPRERADRLLELARDEIRARAQKKVTAKFEKFDPFTVFHMDGGADEMDWQFGAKPPTPGQLGALERFGIPVEEGMSRRQVSRLIGCAIKRIEAGLASFKQLRTLQKNGITDINISRAAASNLIDALKANRWRPLDRSVVDGIVAGIVRPLPKDVSWGT